MSIFDNSDQKKDFSTVLMKEVLASTLKFAKYGFLVILSHLEQKDARSKITKTLIPNIQECDILTDSQDFFVSKLEVTEFDDEGEEAKM